MGGAKFSKIGTALTFNSTTPVEITVPASSKNIIFITTAYEQGKNAIVEITKTASGSALPFTIFKTSDITVTKKDASTISISTSNTVSSAACNVYDFCIEGSFCSV